jgi:hypothetical protein
MERWHREIEQIFNGRADTSQPAIPNSAPWMPSVDLREEDDRFVLRADVQALRSRTSKSLPKTVR